MQVRELPIGMGYQETTLHGTYGFPLAVYHSVMSRNVLGYTPWHWHEEFQFCLVTGGSIRFLVGTKTYLLNEGDGIFIGSGYLHMAKPVQDPDSSYICLDVGERLLGLFPGSIFEERYLLPYRKAAFMEVCPFYKEKEWQAQELRRIRRAYELYEEKPFGYEFHLAAIIGELWLALLEHRPEGEAETGSRREHEAVQAVIRFIQKHYPDPITMEEAAKEAHFSVGECSRIFRRVTGETVFSYLRAYRLERGLELLAGTDHPVAQIADEVGFCSASYFVELFRKQHGITPLQYRKRVRNDK